MDGILFKRARWRGPAAGVVAQYRQAVATNSAHLDVLEDGTWRVDHYDEINPDWSAQAPLTHLIVDHPAGKLATAYSYVALAHSFGIFGGLE